jgi:curved DNA-binding protein CbpA
MIGRKTYYRILMVDPQADADIIATVHRRLAQRYHPDRDDTPEARQRMLEINAAYDTLKSPEKRALYDAELAARRDRRTSDRYVRKPTQFSDPTTTTGEAAYGEAGPPPRGPTRGTVLDFGRYRGWTLGQVALHDPDFLLWLERSPAGRQYRTEIAQLVNKERR